MPRSTTIPTATPTAIPTPIPTTISRTAHSAALSGRRRVPIGAEYLGDGRTHVRLWAPVVRSVEVIVEGGTSTLLEAETGEHAGYFSGEIAARPGDLYRFRPADDDRLYPDPASRFQPNGPHGASEVIDPAAFEWTDREWAGVSLEGQVIYELHVGT